MNPGPRPEPFEPAAVEWRPASPEAIEVRVTGSWTGATVPPAAVLRVEGFGRVEAIAGSVEVDRPPAWAASFLIAIEARAIAESGSGLSLELDDVVVPLPAAAPGRLGPEPTGATVVDPEVFAERRARREEAAEVDALERAVTAEDAAETLRVQLGHLEERLARATGERDALAARVADAERQLRLAEQREEAERRGREEVEDEAARARRAAQRQVDELREELLEASEQAEVLEREVLVAQRRQEEAERSAATERAAREKVDAELRAALARIEELEGAAGSEAEALRREAIALEERLDEARRERTRLEAGDAALNEARAEAEELRRRLADVEARLTEEVAARAGAERRALQAASPTAREDALAAEIVELQDELRRRGGSQQRVQAAIEAVREELGSVRAQVDASRSGGAQLRAQLKAAEHRRISLEDALRARENELVLAREALEEAHKAMAETRDQTAKSHHRLDIAERAAAELRDRLAAERRLREAAEQAARAELEPLVAELTAEVDRLRETADELETELAAERRRREEAERSLADEQAAAAARRPEPPAESAARVETAAPASAPEAPEPPAPAPEAAAPAAEPEREAFPSTGDEALDSLISGLRAQVASAREQLEEWDAEKEDEGGDTVEAMPGDADAGEDAPPEGLAPAARREPQPIAQPDDETRRRLQAIEADLRAALPGPGADVAARDVIASLQDAANRLRTAAEDELARIDEGERPAAEAPLVPVAPLAPAVPVEPAAPAEPAEPDAPGSGRAILGGREVGIGGERAWLRTALERLGEADAGRAEDLLVALLPAQALLDQRLTYMLTPPGLDAVRVAVEPGGVRVDRAPQQFSADARLTGSIGALAPLVAGGAGWRLKDVKVEGARRDVRRLLRARRRPVTLDELARVSPAPPADALLAALAAAVDPAWTVGHRFGVSYVVSDPDVAPDTHASATGAAGQPRATRGRWTIIADDGRPLRFTDNGGRQPHAATVVLSPGALFPLLRGDTPPAGERAVAIGDRRAVDVLHAWFDRARGVAGG